MKQAASTSAPIWRRSLTAPFGGAAGGDQVVDQHHALAFADGVDMDFHLVGAVFQRIGHAHGLVRQLAFLADRHEPGRRLVRHRAAENKAARFDAGDLVDLAARPRLHQFVDRAAERASVAEQGRDVAEHDPGLGIIRDGADGGLEVVLELGIGHRFLIKFTWKMDAVETIDDILLSSRQPAARRLALVVIGRLENG